MHMQEQTSVGGARAISRTWRTKIPCGPKDSENAAAGPKPMDGGPQDYMNTRILQTMLFGIPVLGLGTRT